MLIFLVIPNYRNAGKLLQWRVIYVNKADNNSARKIVINCNYLFSKGFFFGVGRALIGVMCPEFTTIEILKGLF